MNNIVGPIFNKKVDKKLYLWVRRSEERRVGKECGSIRATFGNHVCVCVCVFLFFFFFSRVCETCGYCLCTVHEQ